jgi:5'(3')-deoxyribonucleotidase
MSKQVIAVDLDNVLGDENAAIMEFVNSRYGTKHTAEDYRKYFDEQRSRQ